MQIFQITNTQNSKVFVGLTKDFEFRKKVMLQSLKRGMCIVPLLQSDFNEHGEDALVFEVVQTLSGSARENRQAKQDYIASKFNSSEQCYNIED